MIGKLLHGQHESWHRQQRSSAGCATRLMGLMDVHEIPATSVKYKFAMRLRHQVRTLLCIPHMVLLHERKNGRRCRQLGVHLNCSYSALGKNVSRLYLVVAT